MMMYVIQRGLVSLRGPPQTPAKLVHVANQQCAWAGPTGILSIGSLEEGALAFVV